VVSRGICDVEKISLLDYYGFGTISPGFRRLEGLSTFFSWCHSILIFIWVFVLVCWSFGDFQSLGLIWYS